MVCRHRWSNSLWVIDTWLNILFGRGSAQNIVLCFYCANSEQTALVSCSLFPFLLSRFFFFFVSACGNRKISFTQSQNAVRILFRLREHNLNERHIHIFYKTLYRLCNDKRSFMWLSNGSKIEMRSLTNEIISKHLNIHSIFNLVVYHTLLIIPFPCLFLCRMIELQNWRSTIIHLQRVSVSQANRE